MILWISAHPQFQAAVITATCLAATTLAIASWWHARDLGGKQHDWLWATVIPVVLLAGRWPSFFVPREFNTDESQLLAGARVLVDDPIFWRSVSGGTAGPLDFFALLPAGALCGWETYITARVTAWILLAATLIFTHQSVSIIAGARLGRLAGLPTLLFLALTNSIDLLQYATELTPVFLCSVATYAAARRATGGSMAWNALGGFMLGAVLLAKLQVAPLAAFLGLTWTWHEWRQHGPETPRRIIYLVGGALLPLGLFAAQLTAAGIWTRFLISYPLFTISYAGEKSVPWVELLRGALRNSQAEDSLLHLWMAGIAAGCLLLVHRSLFRPTKERDAMLGSAIALVIALGSILLSGRPFLHYWFLAILPFTWLAALLLFLRLSAAASERFSGLARLAAGGGALLAAVLVGHRLHHPNAFVPTLAYLQEHPRTPLSERVAARSRPGQSIAIWGWSNYIYVETGLRQATSIAHFGPALISSRHRNYYRALFLAEMADGKPEWFLDSSGPDSRSFSVPVAHDVNFPELAALVRSDYVLVETIGQSRLYRHRGAADLRSRLE